MLRIGEFARLSHIPARTLRYYDEIGLLKPAYCDPGTSYRYYTADQMEQLQHILALKDTGLSLEQILFVLKEQPSTEQMQAMLKTKQIDLRLKILECRAQLLRIETWLQQFEDSDTIAPSTVTLKSVAAYRVASIQERIANPDQLRWTIGQMSSALEHYLTAHRLSSTGSPLHLYHTDSLTDEEYIVEVAYPIDGDLITDDARIQVYSLPAVATMVSLLHIGDPHILFHTHYILERWVETNKYQVNGPKREVYHHYNSAQKMGMHLIEVQYPVALSAR